MCIYKVTEKIHELKQTTPKYILNISANTRQERNIVGRFQKTYKMEKNARAVKQMFAAYNIRMLGMRGEDVVEQIMQPPNWICKWMKHFGADDLDGLRDLPVREIVVFGRLHRISNIHILSRNSSYILFNLSGPIGGLAFMGRNILESRG